MKVNADGSYELTDPERITKEWHCSLLDQGYSHGAATEHQMLYTPVDGAVWEVLKDMNFRKHLYGIRFWGPLAKDDHNPTNEPLPRVAFLDDNKVIQYEAQVQRLGPDLYVITAPGIEHMMTTQEIRDDDSLAFLDEFGTFTKP